MSEWLSVKDEMPKHGQHVLVWEDRFNVYPFPRGHGGDDGKGRVRMGDAVFWDGQVCWDDMGADKHRWKDAEHYRSLNGWHEWSGHGPCSFTDVTHWMPLPSPPEDIE